MSRKLLLICVLLAAGIGSALRLPNRAVRPMHTDEAIHAVKCDEVLRTGNYVYDIHDYHGPTLYYATLPLLWLTGVRELREFDEGLLRFLPLCFGIGLIILLPCIADGLSRGATAAAALLTAISPAFVFYSDYYIQEPLLVFFIFALICAIWRYSRTPCIAAAVVAGAALGLMHATKETWIISVVCAAISVVVLRVTQQRAAIGDRHAVSPGNARRVSTPAWRAMHLAMGLIVAAAISTALLSAFFRNPAGPLDALRAFLAYGGRALGGGAAGDAAAEFAAGHVQPWNFYLSRYFWWQAPSGPLFSELFIGALALAGITAAWRPQAGAADRTMPRFLSLYALLLAVAYSALPYKTPWSFLCVHHAMILLAGYGVASLLSRAARETSAGRLAPVLVGMLLLLGATHLAAQAWAGVTRYAASSANPYVYGQTVTDIANLPRFLSRVLPAAQADRAPLICVIAQDAWPLPWYLRRTPRVGYWTPSQLDEALRGRPGLVIQIVELGGASPFPGEIGDTVANENRAVGSSSPLDETQTAATTSIVAALGDDVPTSTFGVRPDCVAIVYVRRDLWAEFVARQSGAEREAR